MDETGKKIIKEIEKRYDLSAIDDGLAWFRENYDKEGLQRIRELCVIGLRNTKKDEYFEKYRLGMLISAPYELDQYMQYLEIDRKAEERFYLPRRKVLLPFVNNLQDLADGTITELFLSQPPRTGKTTTALMFMSWLMGRDTEHPNLYCSYSKTLTDAFYNGLLEILTDSDTYNFNHVFPNAKIVRTDGKDTIIDLERRKHYPTVTCRSIMSTLNGACDAERGVIISDDLISGIEEAMNKDRLISTWAKVDNNLLPRGKSGTRYLWIGTRWSVIDPAGIRQDLLLNDEHFRDYKWRSINIPALNDRDESNFEYKYGVGFDTKYYRQRRASFERNNDLVSWACQYQGIPYEREGTVLDPSELMYYNGNLPGREPDRIFMAVDPSWGGGDYCAAPVCYQYGSEIYIHDVCFDSADKDRTQPKLARLAIANNVSAMYVEANKTTEDYARGVDVLLRKEGKRVNITTSFKNASGKSKADRILAAAPDIRNHMIFRDNGFRSKEYEQFMQNVFSFKFVGKNKHDDAPDSLQMAITFAYPKDVAKATIAKRPF